MDEPIKSEIIKTENFFEYLFNFDEDNKAKIMNIIQYFAIGLVPVVILLKLIKNYFPEEDNDKQSFEIFIEVIAQLIVIFTGVWFIDRIIRYLPTLSKVSYQGFNETNFIIPILIILVTMQTKLGAKINILSDRLMDMWNGNTNNVNTSNSKSNVIKVSQPLASRHQPSQADNLHYTNGPHNGLQDVDKSVTLINNLPNQSQNIPVQNVPQHQQLPTFMDNEPLAANGILGGGFGSSF